MNTEQRYKQATQLLQQGNFAQAEPLYREALTQDPSFGEAWQQLALCHLNLGEIKQAELEALTALKINNDDHIAMLILARALLGQKRFASAISLLEKLVKVHASDEHELHFAHALKESGEFQRAIEPFTRLLCKGSNISLLHENIAICYFKLGDYDQAKAHFQQELAVQRNPYSLCMLGFIAQKETRWNDARQFYEQALALQPDHDLTLDNLGGLYSHFQDYDQAIDCHPRAIALKPNTMGYRMNLGATYFESNQLALAAEQFRFVAEHTPMAKNAHFNWSQILLLLEDFEQGWEEYNFRIAKVKMISEHPEINFSFSLPEELQGKRLLLWAEQGIGDELLFMRFIPLLKQRGATILCQCSEKIVPLVQRLSCIDMLVPKNQYVEADYHLILGDCPMILHAYSSRQIPPPLPLHPLEKNLVSARESLARAGSPPYIGLTWRGGTSLLDQKLFTDMKAGYREIGLEEFAAGIQPIAGTMIALQRAPQDEELKQLEQMLGRPVLDLTALNDDLEEMLGVLHEINQYIAVPNTNVYLRSSMQKTSQVLITTTPGFTWLAQGSTSFWYPHAQLHRKKLQEDWTQVFNEIRNECVSEAPHE